MVLSLETGIVEPTLGIVFPQGFILGSQRCDLCLERVQFLDKATDEAAHREQRQRLNMLDRGQPLLHGWRES
uniref:hypothetical protein n=1 Tax=Rhizobium meliloti TaxID=382 RepID=UPI001F1C1537|nr:hypothetical protein [Sinorhizobium meliloti]